jgi:hypothetical protein
MKLKIDPLLDAHLHDALHVTRARTECEPVQSVNGAFLRVHCSGRFFFFLRWGELGSQTCKE